MPSTNSACRFWFKTDEGTAQRLTAIRAQGAGTTLERLEYDDWTSFTMAAPAKLPKRYTAKDGKQYQTKVWRQSDLFLIVVLKRHGRIRYWVVGSKSTMETFSVPQLPV